MRFTINSQQASNNTTLSRFRLPLPSFSPLAAECVGSHLVNVYTHRFARTKTHQFLVHMMAVQLFVFRFLLIFLYFFCFTFLSLSSDMVLVLLLLLLPSPFAI